MPEVSNTTATILHAAANIMRDDALDRVHSATTAEERDAVYTALIASLAVEKYLAALSVLDRPF